MKSSKFDRLFEPIPIRSMEVPNRVVFPPFSTGYANEYGRITDRLLSFYRERAKGGVGLIIIENSCVNPNGRTRFSTVQLFKDEVIQKHKKLVDAIHEHETKAAVQLSHAGRVANPRATLTYTSSASGIQIPTWYESEFAEYKKVSTEEVSEITDCYAEAARRALEAGYDAVELHGGHGLFISEFLSPLTNTRNDKYGGSFENRARIAKEIIQKIREVVGNDFPILFRFSGDEGYSPEGITVELAPKIGKALEEFGADCLDITAGLATTKPRPDLYEKPPPLRPTTTLTPPSMWPEGCFTHLAEAVKQEVKIPVIAVGRILNPAFANNILEEEKADMVAVGRGLLADPEWPKKAKKDKIDEIIPCIGCMTCNTKLFNRKPVRCAVNPVTGLENTIDITPTDEPKEVLIAGGGPAGMITALMSKRRGHKPLLFEKEGELGGQLRLAAASPAKEEFKKFIDYYATQLRKLNVEANMNTEVGVELIRERNPDVVVCATGVEPRIPDIPGVKSENVSVAHDVLAGRVKDLGEKIKIVGGKGLACETGLLLGERGHDVTIVYSGNKEEVAGNLEKNMRRFVIEMLNEKGVHKKLRTETLEIKKGGVKVRDRLNGHEEIIKADNVVLATGVRSNQKLARELKNLPVESYIIGDALSPRRALNAVDEGMRIALEYLP